jgi:hypothetical protein
MTLYEIVRVGVPARKQDVTQSFLDVIQNIKSKSDCVGISTVDFKNPATRFEYLSAPYGYSHILNSLNTKPVEPNLFSGVLNIYSNVWDIHSGKTMSLSVDNLLNYFNDQHKILHFKTLYIFTCGSPFMHDMLTHIISQKRTINIIDAESPIRICSNIMKEYLNIDNYIIHNEIPQKLEDYTLNIFPGISKNYGINIKVVFDILKTITSEQDMFLYSNILEDGSSYLNCIKFKEALDNLNFFANTENNLTYGIYKNDNSRTIPPLIS